MSLTLPMVSENKDMLPLMVCLKLIEHFLAHTPGESYWYGIQIALVSKCMSTFGLIKQIKTQT